jgi:soluble lytic murein transglycosylase
MSRTLGTLVAIAVGILVLTLAVSALKHAEKVQGLPLSDTAIIREQAAAKHLDPALIAAVIYAESKFEPRTSSAGAEGLMQILPETAYYLAHLSGGTKFTASDLGRPDVNVAYGSYYLRYLLNHYEGNEMLAVAAYNGGLANVDKWVASAHAEGHSLTIASIPFPETREYVQRVLTAEQAYRITDAEQLGIN